MRLWNKLYCIYLCIYLIYLVGIVDSGVTDDDDNLSYDFNILTEEGSNSKINDTSEYDLQEDDYLLGYRFNDDAKCTQVMYKDSIIWNHKDNMNLYPYKLLMNFYSKLMLVDYVNKWSYYYKPSDGFDYLDDDDSYSTESLDVTTYSDSGHVSNDLSNYYKLTIGNVVGYRFNKGIKCVELKYKNKTIWKYNQNESGNQYPKCLYVNLRSRLVMVDLSDEWSYFSKTYSGNKVEIDKFIDIVPETSDLESSDFKVITSKNSKLFENKLSHYNFKQYKFVYEYRFKDGVKCLEVRYKDNVLWKYNQNECQGLYPKSIYVNLYAKMLMIDLNNEWSYFYKYKTKMSTSKLEYDEFENMNYFDEYYKTNDYEDEYYQTNSYEDEDYTSHAPVESKKIAPYVFGWAEYDFKDTQLIVLDVEFRKTTNSYYYYYDHSLKIGVYIAKEGYLFRKIKQGWSWYTFDNVDIWSTPHYYEYANRILVNNIGDSEIYATIYCINGNTVHRRTRCNYKFLSKAPKYNSSYNITKSKHPSNVKVITYDENGTNPKVNDTTKYKVNRDRLDDENKNSHPNYSAYEYKFNERVKCTLFKVNETIVWEYDLKENMFPESVFYYDDLNMVFVQFSKHCFKIYKLGVRNSDLVFSNSFKALDLNINNTGNTDEYYYSKYDGVGTFTPKQDYVFRSLRYKSNKIWEAKDSSEFSRKVTVSGGTIVTSPKSVVIHFINGDTRTFYLTEKATNF